MSLKSRFAVDLIAACVFYVILKLTILGDVTWPMAFAGAVLASAIDIGLELIRRKGDA